MALTRIKSSNIADNAVTTAKINADAVDGTKIADDVVNSEHLEASLLDSLATPPEIYGFSVDANGHLIVTTTNSGADDISGATYGEFKDVVIGSAGITWSLVGTQLRCTT